ncbi:hypothetical protein ADUPG1_010951 [Aduncisulcus paluster]|uniref:Uncharacterized protein n=1 Tax=Aduncisulcus paluster TaxID=2918883 RepID=A0ABQ5JTJ6_9EUKA|nr:hypothetical protein ADUPG1_010951 [Aduncisulcus paluster]
MDVNAQLKLGYDQISQHSKVLLSQGRMYIRKMKSQVREGNLFASSLIKYSGHERSSLSQPLREAAEILGRIERLREAQSERLQASMDQAFSHIIELRVIKDLLTDHKKCLKTFDKYDVVKTQATPKYDEAKTLLASYNRDLIQRTSIYEKKRISSIRDFLRVFAHSQITIATRTIEEMTHLDKIARSMDSARSMEELSELFKGVRLPSDDMTVNNIISDVLKVWPTSHLTSGDIFIINAGI